MEVLRPLHRIRVLAPPSGHLRSVAALYPFAVLGFLLLALCRDEGIPWVAPVVLVLYRCHRTGAASDLVTTRTS